LSGSFDGGSGGIVHHTEKKQGEREIGNESTKRGGTKRRCFTDQKEKPVTPGAAKSLGKECTKAAQEEQLEKLGAQGETGKETRNKGNFRAGNPVRPSTLSREKRKQGKRGEEGTKLCVKKKQRKRCRHECHWVQKETDEGRPKMVPDGEETLRPGPIRKTQGKPDRFLGNATISEKERFAVYRAQQREAKRGGAVARAARKGGRKV